MRLALKRDRIAKWKNNSIMNGARCIVMESLLFRFDSDNPCWSEDLLEMAGENAACLPSLIERGFLSRNGGIYTLTEKGVEFFESEGREFFIAEAPGRRPECPERSLARTKLRLLFDGAHLQRWGLKEFYTAVGLEFHPALTGAEIFRLEEGNVVWLYRNSAVYKKLAADFPAAEVDKRSTDSISGDRIAAWHREHSPEAGLFPVDLLHLSRYDFIAYSGFKGHPRDPLKLINADRFLFTFPGDSIAGDLETIGKFHLWLNYLRRVQIPGYADCDTQEQFSVSWLIFAVETEEEAAALTARLSPFGEALVRDADPCEIWTISMEALQNVKEKQEVVSELLMLAAHPIQRALL